MNKNFTTMEEYAQEIADAVGGIVKEIKKNNGVTKLGVTIEGIDGGISPILYVDNFYNNEESVENVVKKFNEIINSVNVTSKDFDWVNNWEEVKEKLRFKLVHKRNVVPVYTSARARGFSDLIMVPYIQMSINNSFGSTIVTESMMDNWGVTKRKVMDTAIRNTSCRVRNLSEVFGEMTGQPEDVFPSPLVVVTTEDQIYGAAAIIKAREELKTLFPDGYYVIPSSINEVLILPKDIGANKDVINTFINEVNTTQLDSVDVLSNRVYEF